MSATTHPDVEMNLPDVLPLPEREGANQFSSRKTLYRSGNALNTFATTIDGEELTGYVTFSAARLISVAARVQQSSRGKALVVTQGLIIDDPEVGLLKGDARVPHPFFSEPRYAAWARSERPKRINAQQWVQPENKGLVIDYVNTLREQHGFSIVQNPSRPEGSQRRTKDLFVARPTNGREVKSPRDYGVKLDGFEISVNPDYEQGFNSFYAGLEEQRERWESAVAMTDEDERRQYLEGISQNIHFLGGVYRDEDQRTWWARPVDVGMVVVEGTDFPLYQQRGAELSEDLFGELNDTGPTGASGELTVEELSLADDTSKF